MATPHKRGAKTKYTPATVARLEEAIINGLTYTLAASVAGITFETLNEWRKSRPEFSERLMRAEATAAEKRMQAIERAGHEQDWRALAWIMERRHPTEYGKAERQQIEHSGEVRTVLTYVNDWKAPAVETVAPEREPVE